MAFDIYCCDNDESGIITISHPLWFISTKCACVLPAQTLSNVLYYNMYVRTYVYCKMYNFICSLIWQTFKLASQTECKGLSLIVYRKHEVRVDNLEIEVYIIQV